MSRCNSVAEYFCCRFLPHPHEANSPYSFCETVLVHIIVSATSKAHEEFQQICKQARGESVPASLEVACAYGLRAEIHQQVISPITYTVSLIGKPCNLGTTSLRHAHVGPDQDFDLINKDLSLVTSNLRKSTLRHGKCICEIRDSSGIHPSLCATIYMLQQS